MPATLVQGAGKIPFMYCCLLGLEITPPRYANGISGQYPSPFLSALVLQLPINAGNEKPECLLIIPLIIHPPTVLPSRLFRPPTKGDSHVPEMTRLLRTSKSELPRSSSWFTGSVC